MRPARKLTIPLILAGLLLLARMSASAAVEGSETTTEDPDDGSGDVQVEEVDQDDDDNDDDDPGKDWRDSALIYHIWPRSFQDSDGNGEGDLAGITSRLDYLHDLGVDTIRLSPIYSSQLIDPGYDIINHTDIDPLFGDFNDFDKLINEAHEKDLKIILDIIPNHSSKKHQWFLDSVANIEPYKDYYIWADGRYVNNKIVPPNNWKNSLSDKEGSAWTWHIGRRQWYYHKFSLDQPDLNLRNENVVAEILDILDFWLEKGVDGFCICGVSYLYENEDDYDYHDVSDDDDNDNDNTDDDDDDNDDEDDDIDNDFHTIGLPENVELIYRLREHVDEWVQNNNKESKLLIGEVDELDKQIISYYGNETHKGITPLNLILTKLNDSTNALDIKYLVDEWINELPETAKANWLLSNGDSSRAASKFDTDILDGLYMLTLLLPGQAIVYYGEEIGMVNGNVSLENTIDRKYIERTEEEFEDFSRDAMKTPMQWDDTVAAGFSNNSKTFLPVNADYVHINVNQQLNDSDSNLIAFKKLSALRKNAIFTNGDYELTTANDDKLLILKRSLSNDTCIAIINFGSMKETVNLTTLYPDLEEDLQVMVDSSNADVEKENDEDDDDDIENDSFTLDANAAAVLCDKDDFLDSIQSTTLGIGSSEEDSDNNSEESDEVSLTSTLNSITTDSESISEQPEVNSASARDTFNFIIFIHLSLLFFLQSL